MDLLWFILLQSKNFSLGVTSVRMNSNGPSRHCWWQLTCQRPAFTAFYEAFNRKAPQFSPADNCGLSIQRRSSFSSLSLICTRCILGFQHPAMQEISTYVNVWFTSNCPLLIVILKPSRFALLCSVAQRRNYKFSVISGGRLRKWRGSRGRSVSCGKRCVCCVPFSRADSSGVKRLLLYL